MNSLHEMKKRILTTLLAVILLFGTAVIALPERVEAASSSPITDTVIKTRINELNDKLGKTYWNTTHNRKTCGAKSKGHGCSSCANKNIIKQDWFKEMFGLKKLSTDQFPKTYATGNDYLYPAGQSCAGFASFAEWYIFRSNDTASVATKKIGDYKSNKDNWNKAQMGDLIRWGGHSFIFIRNDAKNKKVEVLDCNCNGKDYTGKTANNCMVQKHKLSYSFSQEKFTISRESTRAKCKHTSGYQTEWVDNTYKATVCKKCGATFSYKDKIDTSYAGSAKTTGKPVMHAEPYEDSTGVYSFALGVNVKVLGKLTNAYGNVWYQVSYSVSGSETKGFIYEKNLKDFVCEKN